MESPIRATARRHRIHIILVATQLLIGGCTQESTRIAIETQRRVDDVRQTLFENQHESLKILLFRDTLSRLADAGEPLNDHQVTRLNDAWNLRDRFEFWHIQNERAANLRRIAVDAKLYSEQSIVDLLTKSLLRKLDRAEDGLAAWFGGSLSAAPVPVEADDVSRVSEPIAPNGKEVRR